MRPVRVGAVARTSAKDGAQYRRAPRQFTQDFTSLAAFDRMITAAIEARHSLRLETALFKARPSLGESCP